MNKITRRKFLTLSALAVPAVIGADARWVEPTSLRVTNLKLNKDGKCRFVHFTDFHHKGDVDYAAKMVRTINELKPAFVCFTGDIVENKRFLPEALDFIRQIKAPVYGNPGNHDYWSGASFPDCERAFAATGGAWLVDRSIILPQYDLELVGMALIGIHAFKPPQAERRILLMHYPKMADSLGEQRFDLILAGHSHGGQIRLPFYGALAVPWGVGQYDLGFFETPGGPLYVNAGIGTYRIPYRFNCRPEITVVTI
jgi:predicted MPP superfamily phosphohydrolase